MSEEIIINICDDDEKESMEKEPILHSGENALKENEKLRKNECLFDLCCCCFLPFLLFFALILLPFECLLCCCFCLPYFFICHQTEPKNLPFGIKLTSFIIENGFYVFGTCFSLRYVRCLECFIPLISYFSSTPQFIIESQEKVGYFDEYRRKRFDVKLYKYELFNSEENEEIEKEVSIGKSVMLFFHGGGYVIGHPQSYDEYYRELLATARSKNCPLTKIFSVKYRKSPEFKVDSILREAIECLKHVVRQYPKHSIILSGDSAGGNLVVLMGMYLRDHKYQIIEKNMIHIIPIYPAIMRDSDTHEFRDQLESYKLFGKHGAIVNEKLIKFLRKNGQMNDPFKGEYSNYDSLHKLDNFPSCFIITAEYDLLRSEGELFIKLLKEKVESIGKRDSIKSKRYYDYLMIPGEVHGFASNNFGVYPEKSQTALVQAVVDNIIHIFVQ